MSRVYTALDGKPIQGPQTLLLQNHRISKWSGENWVIPQRPASAESVIAAFLSVSALPNVTVALSPWASDGERVAMSYTIPDGYCMWPDYNPHTNPYTVRHMLHALTWSIRDNELASNYAALVRHYFGNTKVSLPDRVLSSNVEAVQYALAIVFDLPDLPKLPSPTAPGAEAAIALAIEATLIAQHTGAAAMQLFEETLQDLLQ